MSNFRKLTDKAINFRVPTTIDRAHRIPCDSESEREYKPPTKHIKNMDRDQESMLNRAIGYCQALWYYRQFDTIDDCKDKALEMYGINNQLHLYSFHYIIDELIADPKL